MKLSGVRNMNPIKKTILAAGIVLALFSSVGCAAGNNFIQAASSEVFSASESGASDYYQKGQKAMDNGDWKKAIKYFDEMANNSDNHADAALYWKAYSEFRAGKNSAANRSLKNLFRNYKNSLKRSTLGKNP